MIHLLNGQDTKILDVIPEGNYWGDNHHRSLKSNLEKCEFMTHANKRFSPYLTERNRIIISGEKPESYREFIIYEAFKTMDDEIEVHAQASYLDDIKKSKVIRSGKTTPKTNVEHVKKALDKSIWLPGNIVYKGIRTLTIENYTNPFAFLKRLASEFELELQFRIELEDYEIVRYVDMVEPTGVWRGREVEFGKDLLNISRKENTADIVTALIGVGPEREDGTRLEVLVEDKDALKRWGGNGQHLIAYYEPQSTDQNMTKERLRTLTENELEKRVKAVVEYESEIADLGNVPGLRNKEFYFGDQIKIKDTTFNPPLYLEARIHTMDRPFKRKSARKKVTLGDYKELTEEEVHAIWKSLQDQIRRKISQADLLERTYDKETIDQKDMPGNQAKDKLDAEVGLGTIETTTGAEEKANQAESNAKKHADSVAEAKAELAETRAKAHADGIVTAEEEARIRDAEEKLRQAKQHADDVAQAKANLAETEAKAYADGKVTAEEQARIDQARQNLEEAKSHANTKSEEAKEGAKNDVETGKVGLPGGSVTGEITGNHLDIDLAVFGANPQFRSAELWNNGVWTVVNESSSIDPNRQYTFDYFVFRPTKKKITAKGAIRLDPLSLDPGNAYGWLYVEFHHSSTVVESKRFSMSSQNSDPKNFELTTEIDNITSLYIRFRFDQTGGSGTGLPGMRLTTIYLHD